MVSFQTCLLCDQYWTTHCLRLDQSEILEERKYVKHFQNNNVLTMDIDMSGNKVDEWTFISKERIVALIQK